MLLETRSMQVGYGDATAVWDATLDVGEGEIVSVIGPNGAGKTTLINALGGLLRVRGGTLTVDGIDMTRIPPHRFCDRGVALVPEGRRLFVKLSVEENLIVGCYRRGARAARDERLEHVYTLFPILRERRTQPVGLLSGGQQQMAAIGRALMAQPRLLLLDEPSLGLAPVIVEQMFDIIRAINEQGITVLIVEQNVEQALKIANRAYVLEQGRTIASGPPDELLAQPEIRQAYLGL